MILNLYIFCCFYNVSTPIGRLSSLHFHALRIFKFIACCILPQEIPTGLEAQDFSRHRRRGGFQRQLTVTVTFGMWMWHDVATARIVSLGDAGNAGLRKTCSASLTEGLCHTSEERSFF